MKATMIRNEMDMEAIISGERKREGPVIHSSGRMHYCHSLFTLFSSTDTGHSSSDKFSSRIAEVQRDITTAIIIITTFIIIHIITSSSIRTRKEKKREKKKKKKNKIFFPLQ